MNITRVIKINQFNDCKIVTDEGQEIFTNLDLPPDTWMRQLMHDFVEANGYETDIPVIKVTEISDVQFFYELAKRQIISPEDAIRSNQGIIPPAVQSLIDLMPDANTKFAAEMLVSGATRFQRNHPFTEFIGTAFGYTSDQIDEFFTSAATFL
jgi:hypothetical protein